MENGSSRENIDISLGESEPISETSEEITVEPTKTEDLPSRHFNSDGSEWIVRVVGQDQLRILAPGFYILFFIDLKIPWWQSMI